MGASQRTKGAVYEREVCAAFTQALGQPFTRNIGQSRDGGNDIDIGPLVVECKRRKTLTTIEGWYKQAERAACARDQTDLFMRELIPLVVARSDGGKSLVVLSLVHFLALTATELLEQR